MLHFILCFLSFLLLPATTQRQNQTVSSLTLSLPLWNDLTWRKKWTRKKAQMLIYSKLHSSGQTAAMWGFGNLSLLYHLVCECACVCVCVCVCVRETQWERPEVHHSHFVSLTSLGLNSVESTNLHLVHVLVVERVY